jgi:F-type H+-transporting ATPase subunit epsilon
VSDDTLSVELVAADRLVWSGEAKVVNARTAGGEIGILANHMPVLSLLEAGVVEVETADGDTWLAAVDDGFLSVAGNHVSILAGHAEMAADIDLQGARSDLDQATGGGDDNKHTAAEIRRLEARVKAAEQAS